MAAATHGMSRTKIHNTFGKMSQRCNCPTSSDYKNYGGRGIKCERETFEGFRDDMLPTYKEGLTLDRIDNNGNYCKENCRWATLEEQHNNTRKNRFIEYLGNIMSLSQWAKKLGIKRSTLAQRYYVYKWSIEKCFNN